MRSLLSPKQRFFAGGRRLTDRALRHRLHDSRFVDEVEQVRQALGLEPENFVLYGQSWGGILAIEYALAYPEQLKGVVISNMIVRCPPA